MKIFVLLMFISAIPKFSKGGGGSFENLSKSFKNVHMTSEGMWEILEGDFTDTSADKFLLVLMGGQPSLVEINVTFPRCITCSVC